MERLTTNKDVSEMSMIELAHNSCYIKNGKARYRDFNKDWDTRDFARDILLESCVLNDEDIEIQDDHAFDETLLDYLQYGHRTIGGLIGLLYRNLWAMADLREKLKEFEDLEELIGIPLKKIAEIFNNNIPEECKYPKKAITLTDDDVDRWNGYKNAEEQGLLLRLPCKVGDTIYVNGVLGVGEAEEYKVIRVDYHSNLATNRSEFYIEALLVVDPRNSIGFYDKEIGKTVFLTQAEAEQKLKEMNTDGITE